MRILTGSSYWTLNKILLWVLRTPDILLAFSCLRILTGSSSLFLYVSTFLEILLEGLRPRLHSHAYAYSLEVHMHMLVLLCPYVK